MRKFYLFFTVLTLFGWVSNAQIVNIPDANFKAKLLEADVTNEIAKDANNNKIKIDVNNNGEIEVSEALLVYKLFYTPGGGNPPIRHANTALSEPFADLTGIGAFTNLTHLNVTSQALNTLDLSSNPALNTLWAAGNNLTSLNLSGLINLVDLQISNNDLTVLDISDLTSLALFVCNWNSIASLDFSNCTHLTYLECLGNQLTALDLSNSHSLGRLSCWNNNISSLTFNAPNTLSRLDCSNNQITSSFDLHDYTELIIVGCSNNQIPSLSFGNNPNLYQVYCDHNNITTLDFSETTLYRLSCGDNPNLSYLNVKNGVISPDVYVSQFPEPPYTESGIKLANTPSLQYICHDDGEFGPVIVANEGLENVGRGTYCSFTPGGNFNTIAGNYTFDCGGINFALPNHAVGIVDNLQSGDTFTNDNGHYQIYSSGTSVTVAPHLANPDYFTVSPANYTYNYTDFGHTETANFCLSANGVHPDLEISIIAITAARPGFDARYKLVYANKGNQVQSGEVSLWFDNTRTEFVSANPAIDSQYLNSLIWNFSNLIPGETRQIEVTFNLNTPTDATPLNIGDTLPYNAGINLTQTDETPDDNHMDYNQEVRGANDPNDKEVVESWYESSMGSGNYLHYVIRFQNMGNEAAENVVVKDMLNDNLDWSTLQMISSSHPYRSTLTHGNQLEVFYQGINLPQASVDEPGSHGYIAFKVKPRSTVMVGDVIENKADIYFDFNVPVTTNTVSTLVVGLLGLPTNATRLFAIYPNPTSGIIHLEFNQQTSSNRIAVSNVLGQTVMISENNSSIDISSLSAGTYFVTVMTEAGKETQKIIKL